MAASRHYPKAPITEAIIDDLEYEPVPPNRVFFVTTRFVHAGKGAPRAITLDDEQGRRRRARIRRD